MLGGNGALLDKLQDNITLLRDTINGGCDAKNALSAALYTLNELKAAISAIRREVHVAHDHSSDSDNLSKAQMQYNAIMYGLSHLVDIHDREFTKDEANNQFFHNANTKCL